MAQPSKELKERVAKAVLESALPFIPGWIATLGEMGSPGKQRCPANVKVQAAKTGMDLVSKLIPDLGRETGGLELLKELEGLSGTVRGAGDNRASDPFLEGEEADLEEDREPDGRDPAGVYAPALSGQFPQI